MILYHVPGSIFLVGGKPVKLHSQRNALTSLAFAVRMACHSSHGITAAHQFGTMIGLNLI